MLAAVVDFSYLVYRWLTPLKDTLLYQHLGFVSACKHTPTCSRYLRQATKQHGFRGFCRGIKRVLTCF